MSKKNPKVKEIEVKPEMMKVIMAYQDMARLSQVLSSIYLGQLAVREWGYGEGKQLEFGFDPQNNKVRITEVGDALESDIVV